MRIHNRLLIYDNPELDVIMGSCDGAGWFESVDLWLLDLLTKEFCMQNIDLYRDHGLSCFENISGPFSSKKWREKVIKPSKEMD